MLHYHHQFIKYLSRMFLVSILLALLPLTVANSFQPLPISGRSNGVPSGIIHYPEEVHLANVKQLTFGGENAEAYFSRDDSAISFQATNWGTKCDQIFDFYFKDEVMSATEAPQLISTGEGKTTCSFFYPDGQKILYASTHLVQKTCPPKPCDNATDPWVASICNSGAYLWPIEPSFDIFVANLSGHIVDRLTTKEGYDAEGVISPNGERIAFTSIRSGDLELWTMKLDGSDKKMVTNETGYDGGSFFSPNSEKLVWRASRPKTENETAYYQKLLEHNLVSPLNMELFTGFANGSGEPKQITDLGHANWAPYYHPSGSKIIFSSNHHSSGGFNFNLYLVDDDGSNIEKITYDPTFDSFPMFSYDGKQLIFSSTRNGTDPSEINLFLAEWVENPTTPATENPTTAAQSVTPPATTTMHHTSTKGAMAAVAGQLTVVIAILAIIFH